MQEKTSHIIKKQQRQAFFFRELSLLFRQVASEESSLMMLFLTRVELSAGNGACLLYFGSYQGEESFEAALPTLKLYKPSVRKALSQLWQSQHTPDVVFRFDASLDKAIRMNEVLDTIKKDDVAVHD